MDFARCSASSGLGFLLSYQYDTSSSLCTSHRSLALSGPTCSSRRRDVHRVGTGAGDRRIFHAYSFTSVPRSARPLVIRRSAAPRSGVVPTDALERLA